MRYVNDRVLLPKVSSTVTPKWNRLRPSTSAPNVCASAIVVLIRSELIPPPDTSSETVRLFALVIELLSASPRCSSNSTRSPKKAVAEGGSTRATVAPENVTSLCTKTIASSSHTPGPCAASQMPLPLVSTNVSSGSSGSRTPLPFASMKGSGMSVKDSLGSRSPLPLVSTNDSSPTVVARMLTIPEGESVGPESNTAEATPLSSVGSGLTTLPPFAVMLTTVPGATALPKRSLTKTKISFSMPANTRPAMLRNSGAIEMRPALGRPPTTLTTCERATRSAVPLSSMSTEAVTWIGDVRLPARTAVWAIPSLLVNACDGETRTPPNPLTKKSTGIPASPSPSESTTSKRTID